MNPVVGYAIRSKESGHYFVGIGRNAQLLVHKDQHFAIRWTNHQQAQEFALLVQMRVVRLVRKDERRE